MSEISIYFYKVIKGGFQFIQVPLENYEKVETLLNREINQTNSENILDYFRNYDQPLDMRQLCSVGAENISQEIIDFVKEIVLNNTRFEFIENYSPRSDSKDKYNFNGFVILKKDASGKFELGIETIQENYKIYKKKFLGLIKLGNDRTISDTSSTLLLPNTLSIIIKGDWNSNSIFNLQTFFRNWAYQTFERLFNYQDLWKNKADELLKDSGELIIDDSSWSEYGKNISNVRKFVRCINSATLEEGFRNVSSYFDIVELKDHLGFEILSNNGDFKVKINTSEQIKKFIAAFNKKIVHHPIERFYGCAEHLERYD